MFEIFSSKTQILNSEARAGKKEGGWGEGIFARPRFSAAEFRTSEADALPKRCYHYPSTPVRGQQYTPFPLA